MRKHNIQNMLEYWPYATRKKTFFFVFVNIFFYEIGHFNTEFVSPQYKNTKILFWVGGIHLLFIANVWIKKSLKDEYPKYYWE